MQNNRNLKLIVVADINNLKLFTAKGLKIIRLLDNIIIALGADHKNEKHESLYQKKSAPGSCFEPHTSYKDIQYQKSSHKISEHIHHIISTNKGFNSLIISADPKMLGYIRQNLSSTIKKKVIREINKNLINNSIDEVEHAIFNAKN